MLLAHGQSLGLLPATICSVQNGLKELHTEICKIKANVDDEEEVTYKMPNPRVE